MAKDKSGIRCEKCYYYEAVTPGHFGCFYILYAKKRRGCDPENCDKFKPRRKKDQIQISLNNFALGERGML